MISRSNASVLCLVTIAIVLVSNIVSPRVRAQQDPGKSAATDAQKDKETEHRQELEKKTLALLNEIASAAWSLKLPENRVFVMASAAELLWAFDEKRARTLYWDAINSVNSLNPPVRNPGENLSKAEREKAIQSYFSVFSLRQTLLRRVANKDSQLALDMLRATRQVPPRQFSNESSFADDRRLEQEIAGVVAGNDPAKALQVARQSLAKGLTLELLNLLYQLNQKDSEKASQFAGDIVAKLHATNLSADFRASIIALQLLQASRIPNVNQPAQVLSRRPKALSLSDEQRRELVALLLDAALSVSANSTLLGEISDVMPEIEHFSPDRRAALERKLAVFNETLSKQQRNENTYNTLIRRGSPEEIVRSAAEADEQTRLSLYRQAAIIAVSYGKAQSFRDLVSKEISNTGERKQVLEALDDEEISAAAGRKQLDELRKVLPKIRRKDDRARAMAELALLLKEKGENEEAATLLDEAESLIKTDLKDEKQTNALLTLLVAYAVINPAKAFALAERTVDQANSQISLLMLVDRVIKSGAVRKSEIILDQGRIMPLDFLVFKYGKGVAALAKTDFNRTRALADRFERSELRLMAQLAIVRGILQSETSSGLEF